MVGDRALLTDGEVAGLAEVFDEFQSLSLGDFVPKERGQETDEFLLTPGVGGGGLAQMFQHLRLPFVQDGYLSLGL